MLSVKLIQFLFTAKFVKVSPLRIAHRHHRDIDKTKNCFQKIIKSTENSLNITANNLIFLALLTSPFKSIQNCIVYLNSMIVGHLTQLVALKDNYKFDNPPPYQSQLDITSFTIHTFWLSPLNQRINCPINHQISATMQEKQQPLLVQSPNQLPQSQSENINFLSIFRFSDPNEKIYMALGAVASIFAGITFPFFLMYFGQITDIYIDPTTSRDKGLQILYKFLIIGTAYWLLTFSSLYCWSYSGSTQSTKLKKLYYETLLQQEVAWFDSIDAGKLAAKVAKNINTIQNAIGQKVALLISAIFTSSFGIVFAFIHCWELSLFLTAMLPLVIYTGFLLMRSHGLRARINNASYEKASGIAEQAFSAIKTVKYLVGEAFQVLRFKEALLKGNERAIRYIALVSAFVATFTFVQFGMYSLGMFLGKEVLIWNKESHKYTAADIVGTFFCVVSGGTAFGQISPILKNLAEGKEAFKDLMNLINRKKALIEKQGGKKIKKLKKICLKKVMFRYIKVTEERQTESNNILKNITINFLNNKVNALVGQSGSGKSTIVQLLLRYYDCTGGSLTINGIDIRDININNFRRKIGFVGQEPVLFAMTIEDNLRVANPYITQSQIVQYLKKANAWDFVQKMEHGIKTFVGANGTQLSGGQKQRIAIARALCKDPQILVLDEATSALDRKNQKQIQDTLQNLANSNITTIVIAHRLSTIKNADRIFVLDKGELVEKGNHQHLLSINGVYARLVHTQITAQSKGLSELQMINSSQSLPSDRKMSHASLQQIQSQQSIGKQHSQKEEQVDQAGEQKGIFRKLLRTNLSHIRWVIAGGLCSLINGAVIPFFSVAFGNILSLLNDVEGNNDEINLYCWYFLGIALVAAATAFLYNFNFGIVGDRVVFDLRIKVFEKLLRLPMSYYDKKQNTPGSISTKLSTEAYQIHNMITGVVAVVALNSTGIICALLISFVHSWKIGMITMAFSPVIMISNVIHISIIKHMTSKSERSQKFIGSLISDSVSNIRTVKSFGRNSYFINKFDENLQQLNKIAFQRSLKVSFFHGMRRATIVIVQGLIFWISSIMYSNGSLDDSSQNIFVAIFAVIYSSNIIGQNSQHMPDLARAKRSASLLYNILETDDEYQLAQQQGGTLMNPIKGNIEFQNVSFKYPERDPLVLKDFSLSIKEGTKIGLVGQSGSGKSTIVQLLMRIYEPTTGEIIIDGKNIKEYDLYCLRKQFGIVSQEPTLFLGTVKENLIYNTQALENEQLNRILEIACCTKFIAEWTEGLEKQVGQKGSQVSGGQKQRLAIARCLLRKPSVILFDEATSALDADTQASVFKQLQPILSGNTSLSIAHRLSTIEDANWIIVMRDGRTIQMGQYGELMQKKGSFYKLAKGK